MKEQKFVKIIRMKNWLFKNRFFKLSSIFDHLFRIVYSCEIPSSVIMGENIVFAHNGLGVVLHGRTRIGNNVKIYQHVTVGCRNGNGPPIIGDNVLIGTGACVLGSIKIGNNVQIGANAVVINDVPDNAVVVGIPARESKKSSKF